VVESRAGSEVGPKGFAIEKDQYGNNLMTGQPDGTLYRGQKDYLPLDFLEIYEVI